MFLNFRLEGNSSYEVHEGWRTAYLDGVTSVVNLPISDLSDVSFTVTFWVLTNQLVQEGNIFTSYDQLEIKLNNRRIIAQLMNKEGVCCLAELTSG